jgi:RNA polymerase sigma-70 factor (ECF subfamily)
MDNPALSPKEEWIRIAVEQYQGPLTLYAARIVRDVDRARDVVQETFLRLCREEPSEVVSHLPAWLYAVCRNQALDVLRKEKRMNPLTEPQLQLRPSTDPSPPETLERNESQSRLIGLLNSLAENQQKVIRLKFQHGLSYREIGKVTGLSESHVGVLIHRGICRLREGMGAK